MITTLGLAPCAAGSLAEPTIIGDKHNPAVLSI